MTDLYSIIDKFDEETSKKTKLLDETVDEVDIKRISRLVTDKIQAENDNSTITLINNDLRIKKKKRTQKIIATAACICLAVTVIIGINLTDFFSGDDNDLVAGYTVKDLPESATYTAIANMEASWADYCEDAEAVMGKSTIIGIGEVISQHSRIQYYDEPGLDSLTFTVNNVRLKKIYAVDLNKEEELEKIGTPPNTNVDVLQNGGIDENGTLTLWQEAPLLDKGKEYLFFLQLHDDGYYTAVDWRYGVAEISDESINFIGTGWEDMWSEFENSNVNELNKKIEELYESMKIKNTENKLSNNLKLKF